MVVYLMVKEMLSVYFYIHSFNEILGYLFLILLGFVLIYFAVLPIIQIVKISINIAPTNDITQEEKIIEKRLTLFRKNELLKDFDFDSNDNLKETYNSAIKILEMECEKERKKYISRLFYISSISQKGFIDAILILSYSVNLIKKIFIIYHGRVSNRDLILISKKVYYAIIIGGSESIEYLTDELFTKLLTEAMKKIPFARKVTESLADGFFNAALVTRISLITENYCKMTYIKSDKQLLPGPKTVFETTKLITKDVYDKLMTVAKKIPVDKVKEIVEAINPIKYLIKNSDEKILFEQDESLLLKIKPVKKYWFIFKKRNGMG